MLTINILLVMFKYIDYIIYNTAVTILTTVYSCDQILCSDSLFKQKMLSYI